MLMLAAMPDAPTPDDSTSLRVMPVRDAETAESLLIKAGLDWTVESVPIYTRPSVGGYEFGQVDKLRAIRRATDGRVFSVMSDGYQPIQAGDVFSLFDGFARAGQLRYARAGQFKGGAIVWIQAEITDGGPMRIGPDEVKRYALAVLSHDGSHAVKFCITPTRVVCMNTLIAALKGADTMTTIRHTLTAELRLKDAVRALDVASRAFAEFEHGANSMLLAPMTDREMTEFAAFMLPGTKGQDTAVATRTENARRDMVHLFRHGKGHEEITGTRWAAYNAVAEYTDYQRTTRGEGNRLASAMVGSGAAMKRAAWSSLLS